MHRYHLQGRAGVCVFVCVHPSVRASDCLSAESEPHIKKIDVHLKRRSSAEAKRPRSAGFIIDRRHIKVSIKHESWVNKWIWINIFSFLFQIHSRKKKCCLPDLHRVSLESDRHFFFFSVNHPKRVIFSYLFFYLYDVATSASLKHRETVTFFGNWCLKLIAGCPTSFIFTLVSKSWCLREGLRLLFAAN